MTSILFMIFAFLLAISILIAIHEFGHFWVAKKMGVKVLRYSIGFGKPLWLRRFGPDQTEFVIAAIPLGGYVKMLDEREGDVAEEDLPRAFNRQPLAKRFAIVFAGPAFNFLFAVLAYWLMFVAGMSSIKPVISDVTPETPAARAGLVAKQEIIAVAGRETPILEIATEAMIPALIDRGRLVLTIRDVDGKTWDAIINLHDIDSELGPRDAFKAIGLKFWLPQAAPVVGKVFPDTPASQAGFKSGDRIENINEIVIGTWEDMASYVSPRAEKLLKFVIKRDGEYLQIDVRPRSKIVDGKTVGQIGIAPKELEPIPAAMQATYGYPVFTAIFKAFELTWDKSVLTLRLIGKFLTGALSVKNLSGPIGIAQYAGYSASAGFAWFMGFLGIVSINLGILNLLPIPILDGGHLMYYLVEFIKGSPLSEQAEAMGQRIGIALLIMLMSLAFYNDLVRLLG